jgi:hypothetical protein
MVADSQPIHQPPQTIRTVGRRLQSNAVTPARIMTQTIAHQMLYAQSEFCRRLTALIVLVVRIPVSKPRDRTSYKRGFDDLRVTVRHSRTASSRPTRPARSVRPFGQRVGGLVIHARVVERTNPPTPAATKATLDRRTARPQKFLLSGPIVALPGRLPYGRSGGSARHPP